MSARAREGARAGGAGPTVVRDGVRWEIDGLSEAGARAVFDFVAGRATDAAIVKENRVRRVARIATPAGAVYVKHDRFRGLAASLRFLIEPSRARTERDTARRLAESKVPTIRPLAIGERRRGGLLVESWLVTAAVDDAEPLDALLREGWLPGPGRARGHWRRQVARALAEVVARFHAAGYWHRDLHAGNFLAQRLGGAGLAFHLIDLHKARPAGKDAARKWIIDLAWLDYGIPWASRADRMRFLAAYLHNHPLWGDRKEAARAIAKASSSRARFHRARRTARAARPGSRVTVERTAFGRVTRLADAPLDRIAAAIGLAREAKGKDLLRETKRARVARARLSEGETLIVKAYHPAALSRDRARAAWRAAEGCRLRGIEAPRAIALVEKLPGTRDAFVVMEDLGALPWLTHHAALALRAPGVPRARRRRLAEAAGLFARRLHAEGVRHADLKASNILVRETPQGPRFALLDLEDVDFPRSVSRRDRERALAQLNGSIPSAVPRTDRLRAFEAYARGGAFGGKRETRQALRRIVRASLARRHRWGPDAPAWTPEPEGFGGFGEAT
jgi:tRNA A-37 threonylcarbamoyl transferase component Bud32